MRSRKDRRKKKNELSVWTFPYTKRHYLTHPWKLMTDISANIRNFVHRGRFGFAYVDVWNFLDWYPRAGAAALEYLAHHNSGHPVDYTEEEWKAYLIYLSKRLTRCADSFDIDFGHERNEYYDGFHAMMDSTRECRKLEDGSVVWSHRAFTPEEETLRDNYFKRQEEISKADQEYIEQTYRWIGEDLGRLWD